MKIEAQEGTFKPITITFETQEEYDSLIGTLKYLTSQHGVFSSESGFVKKILDYHERECKQFTQSVALGGNNVKGRI
jgi:hypothetical protein